MAKEINYKNAITLAGHLGAGKTEVAKKLRSISEDTLDILSVGKFVRTEADNRQMSLEDLHILMNTDSTIDVRIDTMQKEYLEEKDNFIIDSRLGALFCKGAFNVFLKVDEKVGGQRIFDSFSKDETRKSEKKETVQEVIVNNRNRVASEVQRYSTLYNGFNHMDASNYDLVVDTTFYTEQQVASIIFFAFKAWRHNMLPTT